MLKMTMVTGGRAPQESNPSETKITGKPRQAASSLLNSCIFCAVSV